MEAPSPKQRGAAAPPAARPAAPGGRSAVVGGVLAAVMVLELAVLYTGGAAARAMTQAAVAAFVITGLPLFRLREFYLITVAAALTGLAWWSGVGTTAVVLKAVDQAAFLIAFILLLKLLETGATTSQAILRGGAYLTRQRAGRRYAGLALGAHLLGVVVNLGTVSLLAPLIQRGVREGLAPGEPLDEIGRVRERRQLTALVRGFAWMVIWSPTAVAPAVLLTLLPGVDGARLFVLGLGTAMALLAIGWAEDWLRWRGFRRRLAAQHRIPGFRPTPFPAREFLQIFAVCALLAGSAYLFATLAGVKVVPGLMLAAPVVGVAWIVAQNRPAGARAAAAETLERLRQFAFEVSPATAPIAMTLGASGYIGTVAAALVPIDALARLLHPETLPAWLFLAALPVLLTGVGHLAVSPIMMAVFFGSVLGAMPHLPAEPTLVALALASGWALSMGAAPFASIILLTAQVTGIPATTLTWRWNAHFSIAAAAALAVIFYALTGGR